MLERVASEAQNELSELRSAFALGTLPSVLKEAMNLIGLEAGRPRMPVLSLGDQQQRELVATPSEYKGINI